MSTRGRSFHQRGARLGALLLAIGAWLAATCDCGEGDIGGGQTDSSAGWWSCHSTGHASFYATAPNGWGECQTLKTCQ